MLRHTIAALLLGCLALPACGSSPTDGAAVVGATPDPVAEPNVAAEGGLPPPDGGPVGSASLDVTLGAASVAVRRGGTASVPVTVVRTHLSSAVQLEVLGLPAGLSAPPVTVAAGATTATLSFASTPATALGVVALTVRATSEGLTKESAFEATVYDGEQVDPSFGTNGVVTFSTGTRAFSGISVAVLSDSKNIVGGTFDNHASAGAPPSKPVGGFVRFLSNGAVDGSFGVAGILVPTTASLGGYEHTPLRRVLPHGAGGFVALLEGDSTIAGNENSDALLVAFQANGAFDPAFGSGGIAKIDVGARDLAGDFTRDASGRYVVVTSDFASTGHDAVVTRFLANGQLDTTYGTAGRFRTQFAGKDPYGFRISAVGDDVVIAGSRTVIGTNTIHGFVARVTAMGALDATYGSAGTFDNTYQVMKLDVATDGRAYLDNKTLSRLVTGGALDAAFGSGGTAAQAANELSFNDSVPLAAAAGRSYRLRTGHSIAGIRLLSYRNDGSVDETFGGSGAIVAAPAVNTYVDATALIFTPDHRALGLAYRFGPSGYFTLSRFLL